MSLATILGAINAAPALLGLVDQVVVSTEQALNAVPSIGGSQKFAAAEAKVNSWLSTAITDVQQLNLLQSAVTPLINGAVAAFNAAGIFAHKNTATVTQPGAPSAAA